MSIEVDRSAVEARLLSAGVPLEKWGTGKAKTLEHFLKEVAEGESVLVGEGPDLVRRVSALVIEVRCTIDGQCLELIEEKQVFKADGRVRVREADTGGPRKGVSEKLLPTDKPETAVARAIKEELGITKLISITPLPERRVRRESTSYPGLVADTVFYDYVVEIDLTEFNPDGYREDQPDKTTYFVWRQMT